MSGTTETTATQREIVEHIQRTGPLDVGGGLAEQRAIFDSVLRSTTLADDVQASVDQLNGVPVVRTCTDGARDDAVLVYLHGGAFALGSADAAAGFAAEIGRRAALPTVIIDYRLAPEHPFPAARDDLISVLAGLQDSGVARDRTVIAADSAGGGIALQAMVELLRREEDVPAAVAVLSPWLDLTLSGDTVASKAEVDPALTRRALSVRAADYLGGLDPSDPSISVLTGPLQGMCPLLIHVGSHEILLSDAVRLAAQAGAADMDVTLRIWPELPHVFPTFLGLLDEAAEALDAVAEFFTITLRKAAAL